MNIYSNLPYTYRISWAKTGMNYYGVRYAADCHPSDLFVTYFTSSTYVADYIKEHGMPDIIEVRRTFTGEDRVSRAILHEGKVLIKLKAAQREDYLNQWAYSGNWSEDTTERHKVNTTVAMNTPEMKKHCHEHAKKCWADSEYRKKQYETRAEEEYNKKWRQNISDGLNKPGVKDQFSGANHYRYDDKIYTFVNKEGVTERLTQSEMIKKYELHQGHTSSLVHGKLKTHRGWRIISD